MNKQLTLALALMLFNCIFIFSQEIFSGTVNDDNVRLRIQPSLESSIITKLNKGQEVLIDGGSKELTKDSESVYYWQHVHVNGLEGYIFSKYVDTDCVFPLIEEGTSFLKKSEAFSGLGTWYVIKDRTPIYDLELKEVKYLEKGSIIKPEANDFLLNSKFNDFIIYKNKLLRLISFRLDSETYLISDQDISNTYLKEKDAVYYFYINYKFRMITDLDSNQCLQCVPVYKIVIENSLGKNIIWQAKENVQKNGSVIQELIAFTRYEDNFILMLHTNCVGDYRGYFSSEDIIIYNFERNNLIEKHILNVYNNVWQ